MTVFRQECRSAGIIAGPDLKRRHKNRHKARVRVLTVQQTLTLHRTEYAGQKGFDPDLIGLPTAPRAEKGTVSAQIPIAGSGLPQRGLELHG